MARKSFITRTIQSTRATVLCLDVEAGEPIHKTVELPHTYKDDNAILKAVRPLVETETIKAVHIVDTVIDEKLYGMEESKFIDMATILPPRPVKNEENN